MTAASNLSVGVVSRRRLLQAAVLAGGAGLSATFLRGVEAVASAPADSDILARLLLLEDQAVYLYAQVTPKLPAAQAPPPGGAVDPLTAIAAFGQLHADHRDTLAQAITAGGGTARSVNGTYAALVPPSADIPTLLGALEAREATLLGAYYGAQAAASTVTLATSLASIFPVTARLQALVRAAQGQPPVPVSFVVGDPAAAAAITA